LVLIRI